MDEKQIRIEICGGIAAGKTTLTRLLNEIGIHSVYEDFEANPFLKEFYALPEVYSFETEISFLLQHYHLIKKTWKMHKAIVCDYSFVLDHAYAKMTLKNRNEKELFLKMENEVLGQLRKPDLLIYLKCEPAILLERITERGRSLEKGITIEYLSDLTTLLEKQLIKGVNYILIESDKINFYSNIADRKYIAGLIKEKLINN